MNAQADDHLQIVDLLPEYAAGALDAPRCQAVRAHLAGCPQCRAELASWQALGAEVAAGSRALAAPARPLEAALAAIRQERAPAAPARRWPSAPRRAGQLLLAQARLVHSELWPASAVVMAMGVLVAWLSQQAGVITFLAPLVAAASLAVIYGPENDPAGELALASPTSPWKILLARLALVSGYNLLLALAASLALVNFIPPALLGALILTWLGPLALLSALALLLSLWIGTGNAVAVAYGLWLAQFIPSRVLALWLVSPAWTAAFNAYQRFWSSPLLLLALSAVVLAMALASASRPFSRPALNV